MTSHARAYPIPYQGVSAPANEACREEEDCADRRGPVTEITGVSYKNQFDAVFGLASPFVPHS
jgi:hypothetical protein